MRNAVALFIVKHFYPRIARVLSFIIGYREFRVWLDDKRPTPPEYNITVRSSRDAIAFLNTKLVTKISLDHDLGSLTIFGDGYMVATWIEESAYYGYIPRVDISIHTDNAARRPQMKMAIDNADKYWRRFNQ